MKRRDFLSLAGAAAAAWPLPAIVRAQQPAKMKRMGFLYNGAQDDPRTTMILDAFWAGAARQGWSERSLTVDYRFGIITTDNAEKPAAEVIAYQPDVLFASATPAVTALWRGTKTIPIIFAQVNGLTVDNILGIKSYPHPGGNLSGFVNAPDDDIRAKTIDLLKEIVPGVTKAALIYNPDSVPGGETAFLAAYASLAARGGLQLMPLPVRSPAEVSAAAATAAATPLSGLIVNGDAYMGSVRTVAIDAVAAHRMVAIWQSASSFTESGGLIGYAVDTVTVFGGAGEYVGLVLNGTKPGDLPIQIPPLFLTVNLKTAKALGITIPLPILARADRVIE